MLYSGLKNFCRRAGKWRAALLWMKRVLLAWDNSCDRCRWAVMVTTLRLPALGTHTRTGHTGHTHAALGGKGEGMDLLGTCWGQGQPGGRAGGAERARLTRGMAQAGVASLVALPRTGHQGMCCFPSPLWRDGAAQPRSGEGLGTGLGTGTQWWSVSAVQVREIVLWII